MEPKKEDPIPRKEPKAETKLKSYANRVVSVCILNAIKKSGRVEKKGEEKAPEDVRPSHHQ